MSKLNTPPLSGSIGKMIDAALMACHIGMPARVVEYDEDQQRCSVQPIIRRSVFGEDGERTGEQLPPIEGVPVIFPGAGAYKITFPVAEGDIVWLLFGEGSLDKWLSTAASDVDPDDDRRNVLSDAVAIPGILPFGAPSTQVDSDALVVAAPEIRLGSKDATEPPLKGDAYRSAEDTWLSALDTLLVAVTAATVPPTTAALTVYQTATTTYKTAADAAKSLKVKLE